MAQEQVLMPNAPLFLVDRDWLKTGSKAKKAWTGNFRPQSLYGIAMKTQFSAIDTTPKKKISSKRETKLRQREIKLKSLPEISQRSLEKASPKDVTKESEPKEQPMLEFNTSPRKGLHSALHNAHDFQLISGFESYLNYYSDIIATAVFPIERYVKTGPNPIRQFWYPLALTDSLLLKTFIVVSVVHRSVRDDLSQPQSLKPIMRSLLMELNRRISKNEISEATIGAVSCLATLENNLGNFSAARIHLAGMSEMIRMNQWLTSMTGEQRMKLWKADIAHSMDVLCEPNLPRPRPDPNQFLANALAKAEFPGNEIDPFTAIGNSVKLACLAQELRSFCCRIQAAWIENGILPSDRLYEDISCIQHDLMTIQTLSELDEVVRLSLIVFSKPLTRLRAYTAEASGVISKRMLDSLQLLRSGVLHSDLELWIFYVGGLASRNTAESIWFNNKLECLRKSHRIETWDEMKLKLERTMWSPLHDESGRSLLDHLVADALLDSLSKA